MRLTQGVSCGPLAVVDGATVVGVVTVDDIQQWLSRRPRRTSLTNKAEDPPVGDQGPFQRPALRPRVAGNRFRPCRFTESEEGPIR
jgi:hypothetical protein